MVKQIVGLGVLAGLLSACRGEQNLEFVKFVDGFEAPEGIANRLFGLRASWLLDYTPPARTLAQLSGLLIGAELAGAAKLHGALDGCCLVGAGPGAEAYGRALDAIAVARVAQVDADICVRNGLIRAARGVTLEDAGA